LDTTDPPYALVSILKQFGADNAGPMGLLESINGPLQDLWLTSSCLYTALQNTLYECSLQCLSQAPKHHLDPSQQQGKGYIKSPSSIPRSTLQGFKICKKSTRSYSCLGLPPKSLATQDWPSHLPIDPCRNPRCAARASGVERRHLTSSCLYTALQNTLYECSLQCLSHAVPPSILLRATEVIE
jgi:hypothetical protein